MNNKKQLLKKILKRTGVTLFFFIAAIIGLGIFLSPGEIDYNASYHPFKSTEAKEEFLALYDKRAEQWPVPVETRMIDTEHGQTFVRVSGPVDAQPLVLLHGVSGNSLQWLSNIEDLSQSYRVYVVDIVGDNGRSVYRKKIDNADDYTDWLNELFDTLELDDSVNLVGLSYGGWITSQYALQYPDRLNKVVLVAPVGTVMQLSPKWIARAVTVAIPLKYFTKSFMYWLATDTVQSGDEGKTLIDEHINESFLAVKSFQSKQMVNPAVLTDEELQSLAIPVLFIVGENEKIFSAQEAIERLQNVAPQIQTKVIPNAGHDLTIVQAETVNVDILTFLSQ